LHDVRESIAALKEEEAELRTFLLNNPGQRCGDEYLAVIRPYERRSVNMEGLKAEVGAEVIKRFTVATAFDMVRLSPVRRRSTWRRAG
jgi:hypothetical protein